MNKFNPSAWALGLLFYGDRVKTVFSKKLGTFFVPFALVFAVFSACGDDNSSSSVGNESVFEKDDDSSSAEDMSLKSESSSSKTGKGVSSENGKEKKSSKKEKSSSSKGKSSSSKSEKVSSSRSSVKSSSSKGTVSSSSKDVSKPVSSSTFRFLLDTLEFECSVEGATRYYMSGRKQKIYEVCRGGKWVEMESSSSTVEDTHYNMDSLFNPGISYGEFIDERDNQSYKTVEIGSGRKIEVFAQNLNYGKQIMSDEVQFSDKDVEKYCYKDDPWFCENGFGGLYSWSEAMGLPRACDSVKTGTKGAGVKTQCPNVLASNIKNAYGWDTVQVQGVCPEGWHILNKSEWETLIGGSYVGDHISRIFGNYDDYGFSALPAGMLNVVGTVEYQMMPRYGYMWLPEESDDDGAYGIIFNLAEWIQRDNARLKSSGMSVRCVKNYKAQ